MNQTRSGHGYFSEVLKSFKACLSASEEEDFRFTTLDDVKSCIREILAVRVNFQKFSSRLGLFVNAMERYDKIAQLFVNADDLLPFIWGSAKFLLIRSNQKELSQLLDGYESISKNVFLLEQYGALLSDSGQYQILATTYSDILEFHRVSIIFFKITGWRALFKTGKIYKKQLNPVLLQLRSNQDLLHTQTMLVVAQESRKTIALLQEERARSVEKEESRKQIEVNRWLSAVDSESDHTDVADLRSHSPGGGEWLFGQESINSWCNTTETNPSSEFLWINGEQGCGKTTLASLLIDKCQANTRWTTVFFYCRRNDPTRNSFMAVAKGILKQLIQKDRAFIEYVFEKASSSGTAKLESLSLAKELLSLVISVSDKVFIILDGIDECKTTDKPIVLHWLRATLEEQDWDTRCCWISRDEGDMRKYLRGIPSFNITREHLEGDVASYCDRQVARLGEKFDLGSEEVRSLSRDVSRKANGNLLHAKLTMEHLVNHPDRDGLVEGMETFTPEIDGGLTQALDVILQNQERTGHTGSDNLEMTKRKRSDAEIERVASLLETDHPHWSQVPRIFIVLRELGRVDLLDDLIELGFTDYCFPLEAATLPPKLDPSVRMAFVQAQEIVLTKSIELEKGGRHGHFAKDEPLPFKILGKLGSGGFSQVDKIRSTVSHKQYALKRIRRRIAFGTKTAEALKSFAKEIQNLKDLKHKHMVRLIGSYTDPKYLGLIMAPVAEMNLAEYLEKLPETTEEIGLRPAEITTLRSFFGCLAAALQHLHDVNIRHRDIKPQNILIDQGNVLFTDFGFSKQYSTENGSTTSGVTSFTPRYCPPECSMGDSRNASADIWSLGCVFLEMVSVLKGTSIPSLRKFYQLNGTLETVYHQNTDATNLFIKTMVESGHPLDNKPLLLVKQMLSQERNARPTIAEVFYSLSDIMEDVGATVFCGICCLDDEASDSSDSLYDISDENIF